MIRFTAMLAVIFFARLSSAQQDGLDQSIRALNRGDFAEATTLTSAFLATHPDSTQALVLSAQAHMGQGDSAPAYTDLRSALKLDPRNIDALYYMGKLSGVLAQTELQRLYRLAPNSARVHELLAEFYHAREDSANEEKEYLAALKLDSRSLPVLIALGDLTRYQARYEQAISFYSQVQKADPSNYNALYGLGACYLFRQEPQMAASFFRKALKTAPDSAAARFALGDALLRLKQDAEAARELAAAISISPDMKQAYALIGRAYQRLGRAQEAEQAFHKFQELSKADIEHAAFPKREK